MAISGKIRVQHSPAVARKLKGDRDKATTNEMRYDWLGDRWVIIAPQRTARPDDFIQSPVLTQDPATCPFCVGREEETPAAVATYPAKKSQWNGTNRWDSGSEWSVRVVPNKFPAVNFPKDEFAFAELSASAHECASQEPSTDLFQRRNLFGAHEVVIESPHHVQSLTALSPSAIQPVFLAYRDRLRYWLDERKCSYAVLFKNVGQDAGASLAHTHSQLIATDLLPRNVARTVERMQLFETKESQCLHCRTVADELEQDLRVVEKTPDFIAYCPFASRLPSLVTVTTIEHQSQFQRLEDDKLEQLAWLMHRLIRRVESCHPKSSYNFVLHTAPAMAAGSTHYHWRIELFPRLTKVAGFEWGSDCYINPLTPEDAARNLRRAGV